MSILSAKNITHTKMDMFDEPFGNDFYCNFVGAIPSLKTEPCSITIRIPDKLIFFAKAQMHMEKMKCHR